MMPRKEPRPPERQPSPLRDAAAVFAAHGAEVASWAAWLGGPELDAAAREDVVQEVFLIVHRQLASFRGESRLSTWLYRITANVVRHRRRKDRWRRLFVGWRDERAAKLASNRPTPVEELERRQAAALVYRVLDRLGERDRSVLILFEIEGLAGAQVAERLGTTPATIWVWLHRARARFLRQLQSVDHPGGGR